MQDLTEVYGWLVNFVQDWGYVAVFLGSLIEGESVIFIAGFFAHEGILSLPKIILVSFIGTLFADQALYHVGRHYGNHVIDRFPSLKPRADKAFALLRRYDNIFILSFRFIWGIRIISPIIIGSSGIGFKRFLILNFIAAIIWSVGSCVAAYYFAHLIMDKMYLFPKIILAILLIGGVVIYFISKWRRQRVP
ncbi:MAG: DedA family protein [Alphaproteobacteria bacterium]|nr:DedA family protein [Alphaproteobacteria bacterium]